MFTGFDLRLIALTLPEDLWSVGIAFQRVELLSVSSSSTTSSSSSSSSLSVSRSCSVASPEAFASSGSFFSSVDVSVAAGGRGTEPFDDTRVKTVLPLEAATASESLM